MPRGERIGDAYVRVHADGGGISDDVRRDFEDLDPVLRTLGKEHGRAYQKGFDDEVSKQGGIHRVLQRVQGQLNEGLGRFDAGNQWIEEWDKNLVVLRQKLSEEFKSDRIGEEMINRLRQGMQRGFIKTDADVEAFLTNLRGNITDITDQIDKEDQRTLENMLRSQERRLHEIEHNEADSASHVLDIRRKENLSIIGMFKERVAAEARQLDEAYRLNKEFDDRLQAERDDAFQRDHNRRQNELRELSEVFERLKTGNAKYGDSVEKTQRDLAHFTAELNRQRQEAIRFQGATNESTKRVGLFRRAVHDLGQEDRDTQKFLRHMRLGLLGMSPGLNRARRGWNEMADGIGRATGRGSRNNFFHFIGSVNRGMARLTGDLVFGFARASRAAVDFFGELRKGGLAAGDLKKLGLDAVQALAGGLTTLIGVAAIMEVIATSAGVLTAALSGLVAVLTALASSAIFALAGALAPLVGLLAPLAAGVAALAIAMFNLKKSLSDDQATQLKKVISGFQKFRDQIREVFIQGLFKNIDTFKAAFGNLGPFITAGAHGMVRALVGLAASFADPRFAVFADLMHRFIPNALASLGRVAGNLNLALAGIFRALIPITRQFLKWLEKITSEFADWTNSRKGQRELRQFFRDAADSAKDVGRFLANAVKFLAELIGQSKSTGDTLFREMANALGDAVNWLKSPDGKKAMADWMQFALDFGHALGDAVKAVINLIDALDNPTTRKILLGILDAITNIVNFAADHPIVIGLAGGPLGLTIYGLKKVYDVGKSVFDLFGGSGKGSETQRIFDTAQAIRDANLATDDWANSAKDLVGTLDSVTGAATEATRSMALQKLQADGLVETAGELGVSQRDLVSAALGNKAAMGRVTQAVGAASDSFGGLNSEYQTFIKKLNISGADIRKQRNEILAGAAASEVFTGKLQGIPKNVRSRIQTDGIRPSINGFAQVIRQAKALAPNLKRRDIKTIISATGVEPTKALLKQVMARVKQLDKSHAKVDVNGDVSGFVRSIDKVNKDVSDTTRKKAFPKADLNTADFLRNNKAAIHALDDLNGQRPKPKLGLDLTQLYADKARAIAELNAIPDETVNIITRHIDGGGGSGGSGGGGGTDLHPRIVPGVGASRTITVPQITVVEAADGKATAQELLNRVVALSY